MGGLPSLGAVLSVIDFTYLGAPLSLHNSMPMGSAFSVFSLTRLEVSLPALDCVHIGVALLPRSLSRPGLALFTLDFVHLESTPPLQHYARFGILYSTSLHKANI